MEFIGIALLVASIAFGTAYATKIENDFKLEKLRIERNCPLPKDPNGR